MNKFASFWLYMAAIACSALIPAISYAKTHHHHSSSSSSSSSHCRENLPDAKKIKAPPFISSKEGKPVMEVAVINRTKLISPTLLDRVLKIVTKQVNEDFAPFYGIYVHFKVFKHQNTVDFRHYVPLIIDDLLPFDCGCISFHALNDEVNGAPIVDTVFNPPQLPNGYPYIVIPMGNASTDYGVVPSSLSGDPTLPPTFEGNFSLSVSHEVLETLHDYTGLKFTANVVVNPQTEELDVIDLFVEEVCDPVEFTPGYLLCGLNVSNFVLPSYWVNGLSTGPFDFLNTVPAPFTPFQGEQSFAEVGLCGTEQFVEVSLPIPFGDPNDVFIVDLGPVFTCPCDTNNINEGPLQVSPNKGCCGNVFQGIHVYKHFNNEQN